MTRPSASRLLNNYELDHEWETEAQDLQFKALDNIKAKAEGWLGYLPFLLAPLGVVAAWIETDSLEKMTDEVRVQWVERGLLAATILGLLAYFLAVLAAQMEAKKLLATGESYKTYIFKESVRAAANLNWSRILGLLTALVLLLSAGATRNWLIPWENETDSAPASYAYAYTPTGVMCGSLSTDVTTGKVAVKPKGATQPITGLITKLEAVDKCPVP